MAIEKPPIRDVPITGEIILSPRWEKYFFQTYDEVNLSYVHRHDENNPHKTSDINLVFNDVTTNNVSILKHGFAPKAPDDATKFLDGTGAWDVVRDSDLSLSNITTNDVTTAKHGFAPKAPNDKGKVFRGDATYSADIDYSSGNFQIGNVTGGNYLQVEADGTLEFVGNATVWEDLRVPGLAVRTNASAPDLEVFLGAGGLLAYAFAGTSTLEQVYFAVQLPHSYKVGTDIKPHVHWAPTTANIGDVVWNLEYTWANIDGTFGASQTIKTTAQAAGGTAWVHKMAVFPDIVGSGREISSMLMCRLFRNYADSGDTYEHDASFLEFDIHYESDTVGSRSYSTK